MILANQFNRHCFNGLLTRLNQVPDTPTTQHGTTTSPTTLVHHSSTAEAEQLSSPVPLAPSPSRQSTRCKYWDQDDYHRVHGKKSSDLAYLEDENGLFVGTAVANAMSTNARRLWGSMKLARRDPATWKRKIDRDTFHWFKSHMYADFPWLQFCSSDWKLDYWSEQHYSSWYRKHDRVEQATTSAVKRSESQTPALLDEKEVPKRLRSPTVALNDATSSSSERMTKRAKVTGMFRFYHLFLVSTESRSSTDVPSQVLDTAAPEPAAAEPAARKEPISMQMPTATSLDQAIDSAPRSITAIPNPASPLIGVSSSVQGLSSVLNPVPKVCCCIRASRRRRLIILLDQDTE